MDFLELVGLPDPPERFHFATRSRLSGIGHTEPAEHDAALHPAPAQDRPGDHHHDQDRDQAVLPTHHRAVPLYFSRRRHMMERSTLKGRAARCNVLAGRNKPETGATTLPSCCTIAPRLASAVRERDPPRGDPEDPGRGRPGADVTQFTEFAELLVPNYRIAWPCRPRHCLPARWHPEKAGGREMVACSSP